MSEPEADRSDPMQSSRDRQIEWLIDRLRIAELASRRRSEAMAVAGHDLRQPLHIIARTFGKLEASMSGVVDQVWIDAAKAEIGRLSRGLSDLAIASMSGDDAAGDSRVQSYPIDRLLADIGRAWTLVAEEKGIRLSILPCSARVSTDPSILATVVGNLVGNAIKYTSRGGVVVGCRRRRGVVSLEVVDSGPGIESCDRERIFAPFAQLDEASDGFGLGLTLVRSLCGKLGHRLEMTSEPGRGTRFSLILPESTP